MERYEALTERELSFLIRLMSGHDSENDITFRVSLLRKLVKAKNGKRPLSQPQGAVEALQAVEDWFGKPTPAATEAETVEGLDDVLRKVHRALRGGQ
jgi:hypothetical protein